MKIIGFLVGLAMSTSAIAAADQIDCGGKIEQYVMALLNLDGISEVEYCTPLSLSCLLPIEVEEQDNDGSKTYIAIYETNRGGYGNYFVYRLKVTGPCRVLDISFNHN
jgi:hypothetical protein